MASLLALQSGRLDRHVRRSVLRINEGDSRDRLAFSIQEALCLAQLPGEDEGRIYCIRRVSISGIAAASNRRIWMEAVQNVLSGLASQAVHASDPRADGCNAVFFHNREEALEFLLRRALRAHKLSAAPVLSWYACSFLGVPAATSAREHIPLLIAELLGSGAESSAAGAASLFATLEDDNPEPLLSSIPPDTLREWLGTLDAPSNSALVPQPPFLPEKLKRVLRKAAASFGWKDPATVWLAAQAVLCVAPSALRSCTVVRQARSALRAMEAEQRGEILARDLSRHQAPTRGALVFDDEGQSAASVEQSAADNIDLGAGLRLLPAIEAAASAVSEAPSLAIDEASRAPSRRIRDDAFSPAPLLGEPTSAAGLYFLLNCLHRLGIAAAVDSFPALREADFASHILWGLAMRAETVGNDPILRCLPGEDQPFRIREENWREIRASSDCRPAGFSAIAPRDPASLLRLWAVGARWWCWRVGRLTLREIVNRPGRVWLTRADLDVTLPLDQVEIRIRRAGLDIDPGFVSWFGPWGRVVRFHYRDRPAGSSAPASGPQGERPRGAQP
jgi:hypothetical protein